ncbi:MAG: lipoate--protein ligase family protein [Thermoplasmata archaeon]|nr:MAG: lipoate--protein ligase family protein [Thermoplasmata archaeon]
MSTKMRLLLTGPRNAAENMAIDEAILLAGDVPTLRLYEWSPPAITIGYFQSINEEVNLNECKKRGVDVVRRITGGGAVYHKHEITYSVVLPEKLVPADILESYRVICGGIIYALGALGINASFAGINDILVGGRKISGSAQTRKKGRVLQHGTLLLDVDVDEMFTLLRVPEEKMRDKIVKDVKKRVISIKQVLDNYRKDDVIDALINGFCKALHMSAEEQNMSDTEAEMARRLAVEKYSSYEWNHMR